MASEERLVEFENALPPNYVGVIGLYEVTRKGERPKFEEMGIYSTTSVPRLVLAGVGFYIDKNAQKIFSKLKVSRKDLSYLN